MQRKPMSKAEGAGRDAGGGKMGNNQKVGRLVDGEMMWQPDISASSIHPHLILAVKIYSWFGMIHIPMPPSQYLPVCPNALSNCAC